MHHFRKIKSQCWALIDVVAVVGVVTILHPPYTGLQAYTCCIQHNVAFSYLAS